MKNGSLTIKKINILGSKASELINNNKILLSQISYYQNMFNSNKKYISEYLNVISKFKVNTKNSKNISENKSNNKIQMIKDLLMKYNSEIKLSFQNNKKNTENYKQKHNIYKQKLISGINNLVEAKTKISEDNFLYKNAINERDNLILCLEKDLKRIKYKLYEDIKYTYLNYNYYINNTTQNNKNNKSAILFEDGERIIEYLLKEEKRKFYLNMKQRINTRQKYGRMNIKKNALNDLVTSFSFINETSITPSANNNIFQLLNKKIGGVVKNYEKYFDNEIIDENFFIFLPFELEVNSEEMNELIQTDITLPQKESKSQTKKININNIKNIKKTAIKTVPKLDFLQIEFNKEKVEISGSNESSNNEQINNNIIYNDKNNIESLDLKIREMKRKIRSLKKQNKKCKNIINDFMKFQNKIKGKFEIYEKNMMKEKEELKQSQADLLND